MHNAMIAALELAHAGLPVFPVRGDKVPACPHGFKDASSDTEAVKKLWLNCTAPLIGVAMGTISGIDALDIDPRHGGDAWLAKHQAQLPETRTHRTRSGGLHFLFQHADELRNSTSRVGDGIDVRADGGSVIWWPAAGFPVLSDAPPAPWPDWLLALALPLPRPQISISPSTFSQGHGYANAALRRAAAAVANAANGTRNSTLNREAYSLLRFVETGSLEAAQVSETLARAALAAGLEQREIISTLASALHARGIA